MRLGRILLVVLFALMAATTARAQVETVRYLGTWEGAPIVLFRGEAFQANSWGWDRFSSRTATPPVPASDILCVQGDANGGVLITTSGVLYVIQSNHVWVTLGAPGGATSTGQSSFGALKARYR